MHKKFQKLIDQRRKEYKAWRPIYCPALDELVYFTGKGFNHLRFHSNNMPRNQFEITERMKILPLVNKALSSARKIEQYRYRRPFTIKNGKRSYKEVRFWSIVIKVKTEKEFIRIVLRKVGEGKLHFFSVMKIKKPHQG